MKEPREHIEKQLQLFMQQSSEPAPEGFSDKLMQALSKEQPLPAHFLKPLLSSRAIALVSGIMIAFGWLSIYLFGILEKQETEPRWQLIRQPEFSLHFSIDGLFLLVVAAAISLLVALDRILKRRLGSS